MLVLRENTQPSELGERNTDYAIYGDGPSNAQRTQIPKTAITNFEIGRIASEESRLVNFIRSGPDPSHSEEGHGFRLEAFILKRRGMTISHQAIGRASSDLATPAKERRPRMAESVPESPASTRAGNGPAGSHVGMNIAHDRQHLGILI